MQLRQRALGICPVASGTSCLTIMSLFKVSDNERPQLWATGGQLTVAHVCCLLFRKKFAFLIL